MTTVPLKLGPVATDGFTIARSGVRWLCPDGHVCRPGEIVAYCNIGATLADGKSFSSEFRDVYAAFAPRVGGRLRISPASSRGGFLDQFHSAEAWRPDFILGHIEADPSMGAMADGPQDQVRMTGMAGQRFSELAEVRSGLMTGWHERARAWSGEADGRLGTLLSLGICEQVGVIRGEYGAFLELLAAAPGPTQTVYWTGEPLVFCARVLIEQLRRTPDEYQAIAADIAHTFPSGPITPDPSQWLLIGALLSGLGHNPLGDHYDAITRKGLIRTERADAVLLSLNAEGVQTLRHKRLGYTIYCYGHRLREAGEAVMTWLRTHFEPVRRTIDDIRRDYLELIDLLGASAPSGQGPAILIMNTMSTSGLDLVQTYAAFDRPLGGALATVRNRELNLMLHDLAAVRDISIVDTDAIAADMGGWAHLPDGIHQSGPMQAELRSEILHILDSRGIFGFTRPS